MCLHTKCFSQTFEWEDLGDVYCQDYWSDTLNPSDISVQQSLAQLGWTPIAWIFRNQEPHPDPPENFFSPPPDSFYTLWADLNAHYRKYAESKSILFIVYLRQFFLNSRQFSKLKNLVLTKRHGMLQHWLSMSGLIFSQNTPGLPSNGSKLPPGIPFWITNKKCSSALVGIKPCGIQVPKHH